MSWKTQIAITVLLMWTGSSYALIPCEVARLSPSDETEQFGYSIGVSGEYVVVGAPGDSTDPQNYWHAGAIYVFQRVEGEWVEQVKLFASDRAIFENFGASVGIDGDVIVVGSPGEPSGGGGKGAYVFRRAGETWSEEQKLVCTMAEHASEFGRSVAISGDLIVVGGARNPSVPVELACVFRWDGDTWVEEAALSGSQSVYADGFGLAVSVDGDRIVVGAEFSSHAGQWSGEAYVFVHDGSSWVEEGRLVAADAAEGDFFGSAVSIEGMHVIAGAEGDDGSSSSTGAAYLFTGDGSMWDTGTKLTPSDLGVSESFGAAVGLSNGVAFVGAPDWGAYPGPYARAVYLFEQDGAAWVETHKLSPSSGGGHGWPLAANGDFVVTGTYIYDLSGVPPCIPAVSTWGGIVLALSLVALASITLRRRKMHLTCGLLFLLAVPAMAQQPKLTAAHHPTHLIVRFKPAVTVSTRLAAHSTAHAAELRRYRYVDGLTLVEVPAERLANSLADYLNNPNVLYAEPDYELRLARTEPDDTYFPDWGIDEIRAPEGWDTWTGDADFRVAVIDSGVERVGRASPDGTRVVLNAADGTRPSGLLTDWKVGPTDTLLSGSPRQALAGLTSSCFRGYGCSRETCSRGGGRHAPGRGHGRGLREAAERQSARRAGSGLIAWCPVLAKRGWGTDGPGL